MPRSHDQSCPSCGTPRPQRFCPACGEPRLEPDSFTARRFVRELMAALTSLDSRVWRSLRELLLHPGALAAARIAGKRVGRMGPVELFVWVNAIVLLLSWFLSLPTVLTSAGPIGEQWASEMLRELATARGRSAAEFLPVFQAEAVRISRWLIFLLIPMQALAGAALHLRTKQPFGYQLTLACYFVAFFVLVPDLILAPVLEWSMHAVRPSWPGVDAFVNASRLRLLVPLVVSSWWLVRAERRVFAARNTTALSVGIAGAILFKLAISAYGALVFFATAWAMS